MKAHVKVCEHCGKTKVLTNCRRVWKWLCPRWNDGEHPGAVTLTFSGTPDVVHEWFND